MLNADLVAPMVAPPTSNPAVLAARTALLVVSVVLAARTAPLVVSVALAALTALLVVSVALDARTAPLVVSVALAARTAPLVVSVALAALTALLVVSVALAALTALLVVSAALAAPDLMANIAELVERTINPVVLARTASIAALAPMASVVLVERKVAPLLSLTVKSTRSASAPATTVGTDRSKTVAMPLPLMPKASPVASVSLSGIQEQAVPRTRTRRAVQAGTTWVLPVRTNLLPSPSPLLPMTRRRPIPLPPTLPPTRPLMPARTRPLLLLPKRIRKRTL